MICRDRVTVKYKVSYDPPRYDEFMQEQYQVVDQTVPASVTALDSDQKVDLISSVVTTRYLIVLPPHAFPGTPPSTSKVTLEWRSYTGTKALRIDGAIEPHMLGGRLHHWEAITKSVIG